MRQFRGIQDVYIAKVTNDDGTTYSTDTPIRLFFTGRVSKEVASDSATLYLDNKPMQVINSEGSDTVTFEGSAVDLDVLAKITGKIYDADLDMYVDGERTIDNWAVGYKESMTDGTHRFNWRYKGTFSIPSEESSTINDGTDSTGQTITYTGVMTQTAFTKANNGPAKGIVVSDSLADTTDWFEDVKTPDDVVVKPISA